MAISRYTRSVRLFGGKILGTSTVNRKIFRLAESGKITTTVHVCREKERLDVLAGKVYGDGGYWWIIAAASGIGWSLQVPPGTRLKIPTKIEQVLALVS